MTGYAEYGGWWLEANRPFEPGFEPLRRPIHQDHGGASVDAKAPAKPVVNADAVTGRQAVRAWWSGKPDEADEVGLPGIRGHTSSSGVVRARAVSTIGLGNFAFTGETASWQG